MRRLKIQLQVRHCIGSFDLPGGSALLYADDTMSQNAPSSRYRCFPGRRWLRRALAAGVALVLAAGLYLWLALLSPFGYHPPDDLPPIDMDRTHRVFVYGTLRSALVRWLVIGRTGDPVPAVLPDYRKAGLDIEARKGSRTQGLVLSVEPEELARLDRYERLGIRYQRLKLPLRDGSRAWVYRRLGEK